MPEKKNPHAGHRARMREKWRKAGSAAFQPHELLEMLLFHAIPRGDTNEIAHALMERFGGMAGVLNARVEDLMQVPGIGENAATMLALLPGIFRLYMESLSETGQPLDSTAKVCDYLSAQFLGYTDEVVLLLSLDTKRKLIACDYIHTGSVNAAQVSVRKVMETALRRSATAVILAHNHPGGLALPSEQDLLSTRRIREALATVRIPLLDHVIYADGDTVSLAESGLFD